MSSKRKPKIVFPTHSKDFTVLHRMEKGWLLTAGPGFKSGDSVQLQDHRLVLRHVVGMNDVPNQRTERQWYASGTNDNTFTQETHECPKTHPRSALQAISARYAKKAA
jgi:hypothetical protein